MLIWNILADIGNNVLQTRITSITANGSNYDLEIQGVQGDGAGNGIPQGTTLTVQPSFIVGVEAITFGLVKGDSYSKIIYPKIWNTYIGTSVSGSYSETVDLVMYKQGDRYDLSYERKLDPTKIIANQDTEPFPPADFFGDPTTETFDARLSQRNAIIASPNPILSLIHI